MDKKYIDIGNLDDKVIKAICKIKGSYQDVDGTIVFDGYKFIPELCITKLNTNDKPFWLWVNTMLKIKPKNERN